MSLYQRMMVARMAAQGNAKRVLCVCKAGALRSATAAHILSAPPYEYNTRCAGTREYALIPVDAVLASWAQEIVCMERSNYEALVRLFKHEITAPLITLDIPDDYNYRQPELVELIKTRYAERSKANVG